MPPETETLEETAILEETPSEPNEGDAEVAQAEELDYKALYESEKAAREKEAENNRARDVQLMSQKRQQDMAIETNAMMKDIFARLSKGEIDEEEAQAQIATGVTKIQEAATIQTPKETMRVALLSSEGELRQAGVGLGVLDTDGTVKDERANYFSDLWNEAIKLYSQGKLEAAEVRRNDAIKEMERLKTVASRARTGNGLGLNERGGRGTPAQSDQGLWDSYGRGDTTWSKRVEEAGKRLGYL